MAATPTRILGIVYDIGNKLRNIVCSLKYIGKLRDTIKISTWMYCDMLKALQGILVHTLQK